MSLRVAVVAAALALVPQHVLADSNGMDMSMDGAMDLASGRMLPYLHFSPGDILWFQGWVPQSAGAMVGACIGLFLLAIIERWISAMRTVMEAHWRKRAQIIVANKIKQQRQPQSSVKAPGSPASSKSSEDTTSVLPELRGNVGTALEPRLSFRNTAPFIPSHDIPRGIIYAAQSALYYALMLVVMTFQLGFIISICIGFGVGEVLFGRYASGAHFH